MNQSTSMAGVGDQEDITTVDLMATSSVMEASCTLPIDGVGGTRGDDEDQLTQNTVSVTMGVEAMDSIDGNVNRSGSMENEVHAEEVVDKARKNLITPEVGMTFPSEEKAYEMYNTYAGKVGFSIRKSKTKHRQDGTLCQKHIVCSNQGQRENELSQKDVTRTGCDACVQFSISREGIWTRSRAQPLSSPNKSHKLRSQRQVIEADMKLIGKIREAKMKSAQVYEFMKEFYGGEDKMPMSKNLEADTYLSKMHEKSNEVTPIPNESVQEPLNGVVSFKIPQVVKGPKNTCFKSVVKKKTGKKKGAQKKGEDLNNDVETRDEPAAPIQMTDFNPGPSSTTAAPYMPHFNSIHLYQEDTQVS